ncbi:MAG: Putative Iron dicitrate transmembrane sensor FecR [Nitrospira sp.]|nr:MAG: Putative Iron dicitrate transmembrane sensor FecR [Nitrospira sp.]
MPLPDNQSEDLLPDNQAAKVRQEAIVWLARLSDRDATADDRRAFECWQAQSAAHARAYDKITRVWDDHTLDSAAFSVARNGSVSREIRMPVEGRGRSPVLAVAACLVALILGAMYFDLATRIQADYQTSAGERRTVRLPDQSLVTLNTQSAIVISFNESVRRVRLLKGEAFFKVQHDAGRPFIVDAAETATRAVGTEFVVRHRPGSDRVTVLDGVVEVSSREGDQIAERLPAGRMVETEQGRLSPAQPVDLSAASAWLQGLLIVDEVPLAQVIEEVRRYYPGAIFLWNQQVGQQRVTGTYNLEDPPNILFHLSKTFPLQSIGLGDRVVILF